MAAEVDNTHRKICEPLLKIINQKLKEYDFRLKVGYSKKYRIFKCYVIPFEGRAVDVMDAITPVHAVDNMQFAQSNNPKVQEIIQLYKQPYYVEKLKDCLDDAVNSYTEDLILEKTK